MKGEGIDTERRLSEALQREVAARSAGEVAESTLRAVVAASPLAIVSLDASGCIVSWNASAERMFGWAAHEVIGKTSPTIPPDEMGESDAVLREVLQGRTVTGLHRRRLRRYGSWIVVSMSTAPLYDDKNHIRGTVIIAEDITERERAEAERSLLLARERAARDEAEAARRRFEFLAQASITLSSSLDYSTTLASVARLAVPHIADWCSVYIIDQSGYPRLLEVAHVDPDKVALAHALDARYPFDPDAPTGVAHVLRTSEPELIPYIPDELLVELTPDEDLLHTLRELGLVSAMTVPMVARGRALGAITFVSAESEHQYGDVDLALASDLAGRAAIAVDNARLLRETQRSALEREAILGQIADGIVIADARGTIVFANAAAQRLLEPDIVGLGPEAQREAINAFRPDGEPFPFDELPLVRASMGDETIVNQDVVIRRSDESSVILQCSATPVVDEAGTKLGGVVSFRDVTAQRTLERQKDDFLSAVAHDLKTPLTTIKGLSQILARRATRADTPETRALLEGLNRIDVTATRMSGLINELLDVSRIQMGRSLDLIRTSTDLVALLQHIASEQQNTTELHSVQVIALVPAITGWWDQIRLERAFTNLVSNAITYSPAGGRVEITVGVEHGISSQVRVRIDDEGLGIPEQDMPFIFERFHRGSNVAGRIPGTGIGLAGAREIIQQHGGSIAVRSRDEGGTRFEVTLPLESATD